MAKRAIGIDISHYQKEYIPQKHHDFVIIKASDGITKNSRYDQHYQDCKVAKKIIGAYHYIRSAISWRAQVEVFIDVAVNADFLAVDYEKNGNRPSMRFANDTFSFARACGPDLAGCRCLIYSNPATIQEWMFQYGVYDLRSYPDIWIAQWPYRLWNSRLEEVPYPEHGWNPRMPAGCQSWRIWQYSADYNRQGSLNGVTSRDVDLDVFNGTVQEMRQWVGIDPSIPIPEPEEDTWNNHLDELKNRLDELKD